MNNNKQSGVSLIEVLVSAVLISMIFLWISDTHMRSLTDIADSSHRNKTTWLTEEMLERIKANPMLDTYKSEINGVSNISSYCRWRQNCLNNQCSGSAMVKYDAQQIFCNNLEGLNNLRMRFDCFDINTGSSLGSCATRGLLRGRVTASWDSKNPSGGRLSTYSDALFVINQSMRFDGNDHYTVHGQLVSGDFTIAMWVKPEHVSGFQGLIGRQDGGSPSRSPSMWISSGGGLHYDSYATRQETRSNTTCSRSFWGKRNCNTTTWTVTVVDRYEGTLGGFFAANTWVHLTWIKKGAQYLFYTNGVHRHTRHGIPSSIHMKGLMTIGFVNNFFRGELDDIQVYNSALSVSQVGAVMRGHRFPDKALSLHMDFDGDTYWQAKEDKSEFRRRIDHAGGMGDGSRRHVIR